MCVTSRVVTRDFRFIPRWISSSPTRSSRAIERSVRTPPAQAIAAWRTEALREKVLGVLRAQARTRIHLTYTDVVDLVRAELTAVELPTLRPLLDEIATAADVVAKRPSLILLVQDTEVDDAWVRLRAALGLAHQADDRGLAMLRGALNSDDHDAALLALAGLTALNDVDE